MVTLLVIFALISTEEVDVVGFSGVCITSVIAREVTSFNVTYLKNVYL